jgi:hypothetical protein
MFANDPLATGGVLKGAVEMAEPFDSGNEWARWAMDAVRVTMEEAFFFFFWTDNNYKPMSWNNFCFRFQWCHYECFFLIINGIISIVLCLLLNVWRMIMLTFVSLLYFLSNCLINFNTNHFYRFRLETSNFDLVVRSVLSMFFFSFSFVRSALFLQSSENHQMTKILWRSIWST